MFKQPVTHHHFDILIAIMQGKTVQGRVASTHPYVLYGRLIPVWRDREVSVILEYLCSSFVEFRVKP